jgi:hypothetical protein
MFRALCASHSFRNHWPECLLDTHAGPPLAMPAPSPVHATDSPAPTPDPSLVTPEPMSAKMLPAARTEIRSAHLLARVQPAPARSRRDDWRYCLKQGVDVQPQSWLGDTLTERWHLWLRMERAIMGTTRTMSSRAHTLVRESAHPSSYDFTASGEGTLTEHAPAARIRTYGAQITEIERRVVLELVWVDGFGLEGGIERLEIDLFAGPCVHDDEAVMAASVAGNGRAGAHCEPPLHDFIGPGAQCHYALLYTSLVIPRSRFVLGGGVWRSTGARTR